MLVLLLSCGSPPESDDRISSYEVPKIHVESLTPLQQQRRFRLTRNLSHTKRYRICPK